MVVFTRASGYARGDFGATPVHEFEILPFAPEQIASFGFRWFGSKGAAFVREFERVRTGDSDTTPLVLTIAARVFLEQGRVPERRSQLYTTFFETVMEENARRGLATEIGDRLAKVSLPLLERLAWAMTTEDAAVTERRLASEVAPHIGRVLHHAPEEAEIDAKRFVSAMIRRSGILVRRGTNPAFLHPTFREHLAASAVITECGGDLDELWANCVSNWKVWREVSLFVLRLMTDAGRDVTPLGAKILPERTSSALRRMVSARDGTGVFRLLDDMGPLAFIIDAVADEVAFDEHLQDRAATYLLTIIRSAPLDVLAECEGPAFGPIYALRFLSRSRVARAGLVELLTVDAFPAYFRVVAFRSLLRHGPNPEELSLGVSLGLGKTTALDDNGDEFSCDPEARLDVMRALWMGGYRKDALAVGESLLETLVGSRLKGSRSSYLEEILDLLAEGIEERAAAERAAVVFEKVARYSEIEVVAFDRLLREFVSKKVTWARAALRRLAKDRAVDDWRRCDCAFALGLLGADGEAAELLRRMSQVLSDSYAREYAMRLSQNLCGANGEA
jgi:hypothetical protein